MDEVRRTLRRLWRIGPSSKRANRFSAYFAWQVWKRLIGKPYLVKLYNGKRFLAYPDCTVSSSIIYFQIPEFDEIMFLRRHLNRSVLVDVGANVGGFTLMLADRLQMAFLFEPNLEAAQRARFNLNLNQLEFAVHSLAVSDHVGEILFEDRGRVNSNNQVIADAATAKVPVKRVPAITLDKFVETHRQEIPRIDLLKIDVEGHENAVLRGARKTLLEVRPRIVMFEYLQRTDLNETRKCFDEAYYALYQLEKDNLAPLPPAPKPLQNLFALPQECAVE